MQRVVCNMTFWHIHSCFGCCGVGAYGKKRKRFTISSFLPSAFSIVADYAEADHFLKIKRGGLAKVQTLQCREIV